MMIQGMRVNEKWKTKRERTIKQTKFVPPTGDNQSYNQDNEQGQAQAGHECCCKAARQGASAAMRWQSKNKGTNAPIKSIKES